MKVRKLFTAAACAGACLAGSASAADKPAAPPQMPAVSAAAMANQHLANDVAATLKKSGTLKGRSVGVSCQNGAVDLSGTVMNQAQREAIITLVLGVPGVQAVNDFMTNDGGPTTPTPKTITAPAPTPAAPAPSAVAAAAPAESAVTPVKATQPSAPPAALPTIQPAAPVGGGPVAAPQMTMAAPLPGTGTDPVPVSQGAVPTPYDMNPPRLPGYAWPTYAPYNNFSRVAYPEAYPYNAWPFIGPYYPFPKVPPGWRKVTLEWDDGHWYYGRAGSGYDRWRVRFW